MTGNSGASEAPPPDSPEGVPRDTSGLTKPLTSEATTPDSPDAVQRYYESVLPFYDAELAARGDEQFWRALGRAYAGREILEIGAGTGRVTALLAEHGARVVALDLAPPMLERARERLRGVSRVTYVVGDVRRLALRRRFDLIVAADDPFSHVIEDDDRDRALRTVTDHLAPGGRFVLDALRLRFRAVDPPNGPGSVERRSEQEIELGGRPVRVRQHWRCESDEPVCAVEYRYELDGAEAARAAFAARYWTPAELRERLACAGLAIDAWWGGYACEPWDEQRSPHALIRARLAG